MKKLVIAILISISYAACTSHASNTDQIIVASCHQDAEATCSSIGNCKACSNCKYCKNCSQNGGSCSVCK